MIISLWGLFVRYNIFCLTEMFQQLHFLGFVVFQTGTGQKPPDVIKVIINCLSIKTILNLLYLLNFNLNN
jgi:hypothetical protein